MWHGSQLSTCQHPSGTGHNVVLVGTHPIGSTHTLSLHSLVGLHWIGSYPHTGSPVGCGVHVSRVHTNPSGWQNGVVMHFPFSWSNTSTVHGFPSSWHVSEDDDGMVGMEDDDGMVGIEDDDGMVGMEEDDGMVGMEDEEEMIGWTHVPSTSTNPIGQKEEHSHREELHAWPPGQSRGEQHAAHPHPQSIRPHAHSCMHEWVTESHP
jgi:hypothetical protein